MRGESDTLTPPCLPRRIESRGVSVQAGTPTEYEEDHMATLTMALTPMQTNLTLVSPATGW
jgi:hypothetical protein